MGKKDKGAYNDFLDGEKLRDNADVRTSLQGKSTLARDISPPGTRQDRKGKGKKGKGGSRKPPLTHFLCLPLVNEASRTQLVAGLDKLKEELGASELVSLKAVRPVGTLHLTLGVMSLSEKHLEGAKQYLQELDLKSLLRDIGAQKVAEKAAEAGAVAENLNADGLPDADALEIQLEGLVPMQAQHKTSILYAEPVDASQRLYAFGVALRERFTEKRYLVEDGRALRLHATIVNTIYAKPGGRRGKVGEKRGGASAGGEAALEPVEPQDDGGLSEDSTNDTEEESTAAPPHPPGEGTEATKPLHRSDGHGPNARSWMQFDARELIEQYRGFIWAEGLRIDRVQICKMGAKKILGLDGEVLGEEYEVVGEKVI